MVEQTTRERVLWGHCAANCGGRCALRFTVTGDEVVSIGTCSPAAEDGSALPQACARGRRLLAWAESPLRLKWPLKRIGPRGSGRFERISWDEALDLACERLRDVLERYGNDAVFIAYGTNANCSTARPFNRLMNCLGGYLSRYNDYSCAQVTRSARYCFGTGPMGSSFSEAFNADMVLAFGSNPVVANDGGANVGAQWRRLVRQPGKRIVVVDPRRSASIQGNAEWLPIVPGTDAALVAGLAYELISRGKVDEDFLHRYCVGFDEETMPVAYCGQGLSYKSYVMGEGYDRVAKTPEWAESICGIAAAAIRGLARELAAARRLYVMSGWGPQRRSNGEWTSWAAMILPCLLGQVGLEGTSNGLHPWKPQVLSTHLPEGRNAVEESIPVFATIDAIDHGARLTARRDGVRGAEALRHNIKYIINHAGNCLTNQHSDVGHSHAVLEDESKCSFILGIDTVMTDSLRYADVVLPDLLRFEQDSQICGGTEQAYVITGRAVPTHRDEQKSAYEIARLMARRLDVEQQFTLGRTERDWMLRLYEQARSKHSELPSFEEAEEKGIVRLPRETRMALKEFRDHPEENPLSTRSGKIEFFSSSLLADTRDWLLDEADTLPGLSVLAPIPAYIPEWENVGVPNDAYPFRLTGFHGRARIHSSWGFDERLKNAFPQELWMNEQDALREGIADGDVVLVENEQGALRVPAKVTADIMVGTVALAQGAWYDSQVIEGREMDAGGCINTLTSYRYSPLAKGNPQHTNVCRVSKLELDDRRGEELTVC